MRAHTHTHKHFYKNDKNYLSAVLLSFLLAVPPVFLLMTDKDGGEGGEDTTRCLRMEKKCPGTQTENKMHKCIKMHLKKS